MRGETELRFLKEGVKRRGDVITLPEQDSPPSWEARLGKGADKWQRISAIDMITVSPSEAAVTAMIFCLRDPDSDVRFAAVEGLGKMADTDSENALVDACDDPNYYVRTAAAEALRRVRSLRHS